MSEFRLFKLISSRFYMLMCSLESDHSNYLSREVSAGQKKDEMINEE